MEVMGTWEMQNICVVGYSESFWTADRLQKRGLPHPERCPFCDQEDENIQHILISCVFARQFWYAILQPINLSRLTPTSVNFADWWKHAERRLPKQHRKGFNSLCILGAWILWKHRNTCVFELWRSFSKPAGGGASLQGVPAVAILGGQKAYCPKPRDGCGAGLVDGRVVVWSYVLCFNVIVFYLS